MDITNTDAAWAAGFLDGEGTFTIHVGNMGSFVVEVSAAQNDPRPLLRLKELFGGKVGYRPARGSSSPSYWWRVAAAQSDDLLAAVRPYLVLKGEQADVLLELRSLMEARPKKGNPRGLSALELNQRVALKAKITDLNLRNKNRPA